MVVTNGSRFVSARSASCEPFRRSTKLTEFAGKIDGPIGGGVGAVVAL